MFEQVKNNNKPDIKHIDSGVISFVTSCVLNMFEQVTNNSKPDIKHIDSVISFVTSCVLNMEVGQGLTERTKEGCFNNQIKFHLD